MRPRLKQLVRPLAHGIGLDRLRQGQRRFERALARLYPRYGPEELGDLLRSLGVESGRTVFVHARWESFRNFEGTPIDVVALLRELVGPQGTLAMPAYPADQDPNKLFDVRKTPSGAGLISEIFRRSPDAVRSVSLNHSVCAAGPQAGYLTRDHHRSETSWDASSPYYRLREVDALIIGLGVGHGLRVITCLHCVESLLRDEDERFARLFGARITYDYLDAAGERHQHSFLQREGEIDPGRLYPHFDRSRLIETRLSNLKVYAVPARYLIDRAIELGRRGISMCF